VAGGGRVGILAETGTADAGGGGGLVPGVVAPVADVAGDVGPPLALPVAVGAARAGTAAEAGTGIEAALVGVAGAVAALVDVPERGRVPDTLVPVSPITDEGLLGLDFSSTLIGLDILSSKLFAFGCSDLMGDMAILSCKLGRLSFGGVASRSGGPEGGTELILS
jgi:hypothetical protein